MKDIFVTKPLMPTYDSFSKILAPIWESGVLTNIGNLHKDLELKLASLLGVRDLSLVNNGTIALQIAIKALALSGKVITTPYSFIATANSIVLSGLEPVFIDIADNSFNIDPELIADVYEKDVSAIMPVHVYGIPCDHASIVQQVSCHGMKIIYDAAHAFNVKVNGESILNWGDISTMSFHATKVFHTFEGGALISPHSEINKTLDLLKSFGIDDTGDVVVCGTNGKMNEAQAAMGIALLGIIEEAIRKRGVIHKLYFDQLGNIDGIKLMSIDQEIEHNYSYFPLIVEDCFPVSRDDLYDRFCSNGIYPRKYFYPLITDFSIYKHFKIKSKYKIPNARKIADRVICLPLYPDLMESEVGRICEIIIKAYKGE